MSLPTTVAGVIGRMWEIDAALAADDGVAVFNRVYLTVTERIAEIIARPGDAAIRFADTPVMADLDVRFANLWLAACDADAARRSVPTPWRPLFESRGGSRLPVQYAIAGMNSHIEHDLRIAVVDTCKAHGLAPADVQQDFHHVRAGRHSVTAGGAFGKKAQRQPEARIGRRPGRPHGGLPGASDQPAYVAGGMSLFSRKKSSGS